METMKESIQKLLQSINAKDFNIEGPFPIKDLQAGKVDVPKSAGVYFVGKIDDTKSLRACSAKACNLEKGTRVKWYELDSLEKKLNAGDVVLYIGKANPESEDSKYGLKDRLRNYMKSQEDFQKGKSSNHQGGRAIWQLENAKELGVCWIQTKDASEAKELEKALLKKYKEDNPNAGLEGREAYPFANWRL
ncbi:GIY-YIG nuclease family protein [Fibrobacter intestinalis]|uniref:GIY-YIG domain-containing protein n=1 Tax=Fibrobacter intestinalis TaxID=28122 RepID=A0A1T4M571_9BACT|nr:MULTISPECIES: hypothetical protein [Fibrobacter]PBC73450.1 hypothetical protein BGW94_1054 [Fibrobacter sp. NR9]SJZ62149.1 hypothetical protein SAMN02745108_01141 [Fibrobacter intestinalis]